jgi:thioredoxin reductase (NADPH)
MTGIQKIYDVAIIGAGPIGIYASYYAGLRDMKVLLLESLGQLGGQLRALYPKKYIYDVAGYPKILAEDLIENLVEQSKQYSPDLILNDKIVDLQITDHRSLKLTSEKGSSYQAKSVLLCAGIGAFMPQKLGVQDAEKLEGKGLHYFIKDPEIFRDKRLLMIGGGDSALHWSLTLQKYAKEITHIHMLKQFHAHEESVVKLMQAENITVHIHSQLKEIFGEDHIEKVTIVNNVDGSEQTVEIDEILCFIGYITNLGPVRDWGLEIVGNAVKVNDKMETNLPGVYGAGDMVWHPAKIKLITTGFGDAVIAVNNAKQYIESNARIFPGNCYQTVPV